MTYLASCEVFCEVEANDVDEAIAAGWNKFESLGIGPNGPTFYGYDVYVEKWEKCGG